MRPRPAVPATRRAAGGVLTTVLAACGALAACHGRDQTAAGTAAGVDSALARDLTLASGAGRPTLGPAISFGDTAVGGRAARAAPADAPTTAPRMAPERRPRPIRHQEPRPTPRPAQAVADAPAAAPTPPVPNATPAPPAAGALGAPGPAAVGHALAAGTVLAGTTGQAICTETNRPGDRITARLGEDVAGPGGVRLPAGTPVVLEVAHVTTEPDARVEFVARGVSVDGVYQPIVADVTPVTGTVERRAVPGAPGDTRGKVTNGAVIGAILGGILGRSTKATIIGAAGGAATGAVMSKSATRYESCLQPGAAVRVRLVEPLAVR